MTDVLDPKTDHLDQVMEKAKEAGCKDLVFGGALGAAMGGLLGFLLGGEKGGAAGAALGAGAGALVGSKANTLGEPPPVDPIE